MKNFVGYLGYEKTRLFAFEIYWPLARPKILNPELFIQPLLKAAKAQRWWTVTLAFARWQKQTNGKHRTENHATKVMKKQSYQNEMNRTLDSES